MEIPVLTGISNKLTRKFPKLSALLLNELPVHTLEKTRPSLLEGYSKRIPPNVYQSWINNKFGKSHMQQMLAFRKINPDLNFFLFNDEEVNAYMLEFWGGHDIYKIYSSAKYGPMKTDIFRYCILYERGGFYFDINKGISRQISTLIHDDDTSFMSFEGNDCIIMPDKVLMTKLMHPEKYVLQWGFGFCAKNPVLEKVIANICEYYDFFAGKRFDSPQFAILSHTATGMLTKSVRDVLSNDIDFKITQAGIDFFGYGIFDMRRSWSRYVTSASYVLEKQKMIV
jgi:mannosyltransferase OCH1-like enzyme